MKKEEITTYNLIKDLAEGYSKQSKSTNQIWIFLMIASIYTLSAKGLTVELPFGMGKVNETNFHFMSLIIISSISIAYSSAMIQTIRIRKLIQKVIDNLESKIINGIHVEDYIDSILNSTYNRISPISQFFLGKNQFLDDKSHQNIVIRFIAILFYFCLKVFTIFVYAIPIFILYTHFMFIRNYCEYTEYADYKYYYISIVLGAIALISFLVLIIGEFRILFSVVRKILK